MFPRMGLHLHGMYGTEHPTLYTSTPSPDSSPRTVKSIRWYYVLIIVELYNMFTGYCIIKGEIHSNHAPAECFALVMKWRNLWTAQVSPPWSRELFAALKKQLESFACDLVVYGRSASWVSTHISVWVCYRFAVRFCDRAHKQRACTRRQQSRVFSRRIVGTHCEVLK